MNEASTKKFGLGNNAIGKMIGIGHTFDDRHLDIRIVGVARDAKYSEVKGARSEVAGLGSEPRDDVAFFS